MLRALIADSYPNWIKQLETGLKAEGIAVEWVEDGSDALAWLPSDPDAFQIVWTGVILRQMDGFELIEALRKYLPTQHLPIIALLWPPNIGDEFHKALSRLFVVHEENPPLLLLYRWPDDRRPPGDRFPSFAEKVRAVIGYLREHGFLTEKEDAASPLPEGSD